MIFTLSRYFRLLRNIEVEQNYTRLGKDAVEGKHVTRQGSVRWTASLHICPEGTSEAFVGTCIDPHTLVELMNPAV